MHVGGSIVLEVGTFGLRVDLASDLGLGLMQVKRQAESRLREHFAHPILAQPHAAIEKADEDDVRELRRSRRAPEPL
jgi:hypothetical protein